MMRALCVLFCLSAFVSCKDPAKERERRVEELTTLSNDQCIRGWLGDTRRARLVADVEAGRLTDVELDEYMKRVRARINASDPQKTSVESFCTWQRNLWREVFFSR